MADSRSTTAKDHDLLIEIHVLVRGLIVDVQNLKQEAMMRIGELSGKKAENVEVVALNGRVTALEKFRWQAAGAIIAFNALIAVAVVLFNKFVK